jgi:hypothetical protein
MDDSAMHSRFAAEEAFVKTMWEYRHTRAPIIEQEYYTVHGDSGNNRMRNELYDRILRLLGANKGFMMEFAERDADCYKPNTDYFYNRGFADCLMFLRTIHGVADKSLSLERVLLYQDRIDYDGEWAAERGSSTHLGFW